MVALVQRVFISLFVGLSTVVVNHTVITTNNNASSVVGGVEVTPGFTSSDTVREESLTPKRMEPAQVEFAQQVRNPKVASTRYWNRVAQCETGSNWQNGGQYSGGLGIYINTWISYGGRQFADVPHKATKLQQIVVANRISVLGFQTKNKYITFDDRINNRPYFQNPVGFTGWGCIKNTIGKPKKTDLVHTKKKSK